MRFSGRIFMSGSQCVASEVRLFRDGVTFCDTMKANSSFVIGVNSVWVLVLLGNISSKRLLLGMEFFILKHLRFGPSGTPALLAAYLLASFLFGRLSAHNERFDLIDENPSGKKPVQRLRSLLLAFDFDAGRRMFQIDARGRLIDFLSALFTGKHEKLDNIGFPDPGRRHLRL